jgi:hypothetical protein
MDSERRADANDALDANGAAMEVLKSTRFAMCAVSVRYSSSRRTSGTAILAGDMPSLELADRELQYLARMNGENIFLMQQIAKKNKTRFPDLPVAEAIQAKFAAMLPGGLPDPFPNLAAGHSTKATLRKADSALRARKR